MTAKGQHLRAVRETHGRGLREVARKVGYDPAYLSRVERGLQRPTPELLIALGKELGLRDLVRTLETYWSAP